MCYNYFCQENIAPRMLSCNKPQALYTKRFITRGVGPGVYTVQVLYTPQDPALSAINPAG